MDGDRPIVAFDFDGTMTVRDSFTAFLVWRAGAVAFALGILRLLPAGLVYVFNRDRGWIKAKAVGVFLKGVDREQLEADCRRFAQERAPALLRPDAVATWRRWQAAGVRLLIVTASPDILVRAFGEALGADEVLGTKIAFDAQGRVRGAFESPNCRGPEKVARLKARFGDDVRLKAAYGDTSGDTEMLAIAEEAGYRVFTAKP